VYPKDDGSTANDSKGHGTVNDPNNFQNFPVLTSAINSGSSVQIGGSLTQSGSPNTTFRIEFFSSSPDPGGGAAEGQTFIGATNVATNGAGVGSISAMLNVAVPIANVITATATNMTADPSSQSGAVNVFNTSEFSAAITTVLPDYTVTIPSGSATVAAGQSANFTITITPQGGFSSAVSLSCSGLPAQSSCGFVPPSLTPSGAVSSALTITTTAHTLASASPAPGVLASALTGFGLLGVVIVGGATRRKRVRQSAAMLLVVMAIVASVAGCGGGHTKVPNPNSGTPAGTYTVTVTAASGGTSHTGTITLTVQ
jgi:hypothetical protein